MKINNNLLFYTLFGILLGSFGFKKLNAMAVLELDSTIVDSFELKTIFYKELVCLNKTTNEVNPAVYDIYTANLAKVYKLLLPEQSPGSKAKAVGFIKLLANQNDNLWVKYYAMYLYATVDTPVLIKERGYSYFHLDDLSKVLIAKKLLIQVVNQDINIRAKGKGALALGLIEEKIVRNNDYSVVNYYYSIAKNQDCDAQARQLATFKYNKFINYEPDYSSENKKRGLENPSERSPKKQKTYHEISNEEITNNKMEH